MKEEESIDVGSGIEVDEPEIEMLDLPYLETIENRDDNLLYPDVDAYWFLVFPKLQVYRFLYIDQEHEDDQGVEYSERFRPILLIHGFKSTYSTWNWMAQQLWEDGFRNIFAMELFSYTSGFPKLFDQLTQTIDQILSILPSYEFLTIIGHSLGGMIARYYLKQKTTTFSPKVRLCVTCGSPHYGVFNILKPFANAIFGITKSFIPSQMDIVKNFSPKGRMVKINEAVLTEDVYTSTMINIAGTLPLLGTDGLFKAKPINDMVNIKVSANHFMVNKIDASYQVIRGLLFNRTTVFKLRLLYIKISKKREVSKKNYYFQINSQDDQCQRYPISGFIELNDRILVPKKPLIIYVGISLNLDSDEILIQVFEKKPILQDFCVVNQKVVIPISSKEKIFDSIVLTAPADNTKFVLALFSYKLNHTY